MSEQDDDCEFCDGCGEVSAITRRMAASSYGEHEPIGCPLCIERAKNEQIESLTAQRDALLAALRPIVDEFKGTIEQYDKLGCDVTQRDGTELFHVGVVLDRRELIEAAQEAIAAAEGATP